MMSRNATRAFQAIVVVGLAANAAAQTAPSPAWNGSVRCEIDLKGPGYASHQTHTWTLTGALPADGGVLDYPGTWTVTGEASRLPTTTGGSAATWKTQGSAPGVRMAIYVRPSDHRLLVFLRNTPLSVPNGTIGTEQTAATSTLRERLQPISTTAYEWRPFPTIEDVPTSTRITGSSTTPVSRLDASQPIGTSGQAVCSWELVQGAIATGASTAAQIARPALTPAGTGGTIAAIEPTTPTRDRPLSSGLQQTIASASASLAAAAAATTCSTESNRLWKPTDPCVTISGPTQLRAGSTGTFVLQVRNLSPNQSTVVSSDGTSRTMSTSVEVEFTFDSGEGDTLRQALRIPADRSGSLSPSATFTFQNAGSFTVSAQGAMRQIVDTLTTIPVYDANQVRIGSRSTQEPPVVYTFPGSVRLNVTVSP